MLLHHGTAWTLRENPQSHGPPANVPSTRRLCVPRSAIKSDVPSSFWYNLTFIHIHLTFILYRTKMYRTNSVITSPSESFAPASAVLVLNLKLGKSIVDKAIASLHGQYVVNAGSQKISGPESGAFVKQYV